MADSFFASEPSCVKYVHTSVERTLTKTTMNWGPPERWSNRIKRTTGANWQQVVMDQMMWKELGDAYIQQWLL